VAVAFRFAATSSGFQQRLLFERLMAEQVEPAARRDLKEPAFLRLDLDDRFPRLSVETEPRRRTALYGPFRDKAQAARAREAIHKRHPLRPCDYSFEPDPALPLGLACLFAQVRSCSAPCLSRIAEAEYRALAARVASRLADPRHRGADVPEGLPPWVARFDGRRALVAERGADGIELYPILEGSVLDAGARSVTEEELPDALSGLAFEPPSEPRNDLPWLAAWLAAPRRRGIYLGWRDDASELAASVREALGPPA